MKLTHLSPLALWAIITTLTAAAPTTTSNPNDPFNLTPKQAISAYYNSNSHNDSGIEKRATCNIIPGDSNRMLVDQAVMCRLDLNLKGSEEVVIPEGGVDICTRSSGKFSVTRNGNGEQRTTKREIARAATRILDACKTDDHGWVQGQESITNGIFIVIS